MIKCPKCGALNSKSAKFCIKCGTPLRVRNINNHAQNKSNLNRQPNQQAQNNQQVNNISNDYINWLKDTLRNPLSPKNIYTSPYFGMISFILSAVFSWIALLIAKKITKNSSSIKYITHLIHGNKSILNFFSTIGNSNLSLLFSSIINIALVVAIAFIGTKRISDSKLNIFSFSNYFASITNILIPCSILLIFCSIIPTHTGFIIYLICTCMLITYIVGISTSIINAKSKTNTVNKIYVAIFASLIYMILLPLINSIIGRVF